MTTFEIWVVIIMCTLIGVMIDKLVFEHVSILPLTGIFLGLISAGVAIVYVNTDYTFFF